MNSVDPRLIKTMLQYRLTPGVDLSSPGGSGLSSVAAGGGTPFAAVLRLMLADADPAPDALFGGSLGDIAGASLPVALVGLGDAAVQPAAGELPIAYIGPGTATPPAFVGFGAIDTAAGSSAGRPADFEELIAQAAARHGVNPSLIKAVIDTESNFNPNAVSSAGAKGLMQLMDGTARGLGVTDSFDPMQNIEGGTRFLSYLLDKYAGNTKAALAAYNAGPGRVDRLGIRTDADVENNLANLPGETQRYVGKVLKAMDRYVV
ncbi:lytic transglycosylase domain-containing protein [uncultured Paenibacillus sp.]|uniref:lytic transglycosylase domain-containing protein n=1 Tax=uncultured Paenibacillus sp. TaxID=227322 RepID=UPI0028D31B3E|nr:lytic transglycosylase domain-containing protein [uncultured Paenibacillus sp.]